MRVRAQHAQSPAIHWPLQRTLELMKELAGHADGPPLFQLPPNSHVRRSPCEQQRPAHVHSLPYISRWRAMRASIRGPISSES
jgi:hypothetical protein